MIQTLIRDLMRALMRTEVRDLADVDASTDVEESADLDASPDSLLMQMRSLLNNNCIVGAGLRRWTT